MKKLPCVAAVLCVYLSVGLCCAQTITIENPKAKVVMSLTGGTTTSFLLKSQNLSPFHALGHFICFDRWGPSSPEDLARGVPQHGEAHVTKWTLDTAPKEEANAYVAELSCLLPIMKLKIDRTIHFDKNEAVYQVTDKISNPNAIKQVFNLVQHVTLGAPFLDSTTIVDTKVSQGFWQSGVVPPTGSAILGWPQVNLGGKALNLQFQHPVDLPNDYVISYALPPADTFGWVTAINKSKKLLIGYVWLNAESSWINFWSNTSQVARGLEFGTGGLHQPWPAVIQMGSIFNLPIYEYVTPGTPITKSFTAFLAEIPIDFKGVSQVAYQKDKITITETGGIGARTIVIPFTINGATAVGLPAPGAENAPSFAFASKTGAGAQFTLRYSLAASQRVVLELFSAQGRKICDLLDGVEQPGMHTVVRSLPRLTGGMYICRMKIGERETRVSAAAFMQ
jgi:hypothetical protein